jgi:hypothetical protein
MLVGCTELGQYLVYQYSTKGNCVPAKRLSFKRHNLTLEESLIFIILAALLSTNVSFIYA